MGEPQAAGPGEQRWVDETVGLCSAAAANGAYQGRAFLSEAARDYSRLWGALPACATPQTAMSAWQEFWAARTASYLGAAFRAASAPTVEAEAAAAQTAEFRLPD